MFCRQMKREDIPVGGRCFFGDPKCEVNALVPHLGCFLANFSGDVKERLLCQPYLPWRPNRKMMKRSEATFNMRGLRFGWSGRYGYWAGAEGLALVS